MQIRIKLLSLSTKFHNKILIIDNKRFKHIFNILFEKKFTNGSKEIVESYHNGNLSMYSETKYFISTKEVNCYGVNGDLFSIEKIFYNTKGKAFKEYHKIYNSDGTILEYTDSEVDRNFFLTSSHIS